MAGYTSHDPEPGVIAHVIGVPAEARRAASSPGATTALLAWAHDGDEGRVPALRRYIGRADGRPAGMTGPAPTTSSGPAGGEVEGRALTDAEIEPRSQFIVASAVDTTRKLLANLFTLAPVRPRPLPAPREPSRPWSRSAVEETLRFLAPVQTVAAAVHPAGRAGRRGPWPPGSG